MKQPTLVVTRLLRLLSENPATFTPENGAWGRAGCTKVRLDSVAEEMLGEAMTLAWQNTAKTVSKRSKTKPTTKRK